MENESLLKTEFNLKFVELCKNRMVMSYYKYGPIKENYGNKLVSSIDNLQKRIDLYNKTGNTEYLVDIANFAMIEYMYPQHVKSHFKPTDSNGSPGLGAITYKDIENS